MTAACNVSDSSNMTGVSPPNASSIVDASHSVRADRAASSVESLLLITTVPPIGKVFLVATILAIAKVVPIAKVTKVSIKIMVEVATLLVLVQRSSRICRR